MLGGYNDYYFPVEMYRETAAGIPNAKLVLYEGKGNIISGKKFNEDILAFLNGNENWFFLSKKGDFVWAIFFVYRIDSSRLLLLLLLA